MRKRNRKKQILNFEIKRKDKQIIVNKLKLKLNISREKCEEDTSQYMFLFNACFVLE